MSALSREYPVSFNAALNLAKTLLSSNSDLVEKGVIEAEAEQIVIAAYREGMRQSNPITRVELYARMRDGFPPAAGKQVIIMAGRRSQGEPLQYITGTQYFLNHEYRVRPGVLVPRPETEVMVARAMEELCRAFAGGPRLGLEIGLGSGIISIELLDRFPDLRMLASEVSIAAAEVARENVAAILGSEDSGRLRILPIGNARTVWDPFAELLHEETKMADFVISNPPYLTEDDSVDSEVRAYEPAIALFAPPSDPLFFYREVALNAARFLRKEGWVFMEVPHERGQEICRLFNANGWASEVLTDLTGRDRVLIGRLR